MYASIVADSLHSMAMRGADMTIKGGIALDRVAYSEAARSVFDIAVNHRRLGLKLGDDALRGMRFGSDSGVLARLESMFTEGEFMACPGTRIDAALIDAAQSDHWYTHEKDYEMPECLSDETEIAEDEDE